MYRRGLTLLLLVVMLLTQWVGLYRCMGKCDAVGQDGRPHVHMNSVFPVQSGTQRCGCQHRIRSTEPQAGQPSPSCKIANGLNVNGKIPDSQPVDNILYLSSDPAEWIRECGNLLSVEIGEGHGENTDETGVFARWPDHLGDPHPVRISTLTPPRPHCPVYILTRSLLL